MGAASLDILRCPWTQDRRALNVTQKPGKREKAGATGIKFLKNTSRASATASPDVVKVRSVCVGGSRYEVKESDPPPLRSLLLRARTHDRDRQHPPTSGPHDHRLLHPAPPVKPSSKLYSQDEWLRTLESSQRGFRLLDVHQISHCLNSSRFASRGPRRFIRATDPTTRSFAGPFRIIIS